MSAAAMPPNPAPAEAPLVPHRTSPWFGRLLTVGLIVVAGIAFLQPWKSLHSEPVSNGRHQAATNVKQVQVAQPSAATNSNVVLPATVRPWQTTTLHARVSGYLTKWHRDLGEQVKAGELLAEIETPELDQELAEGEALASEAAAVAIQARAERQEAEADLKVTEAQAVRIRADAELAILQLGRRERLLTTATISQEEFDTFQKQVEARNADVAASEADVARRRTNLDTRTAIITAREATAKSRLANVERLKQLQAFKRISTGASGLGSHVSCCGGPPNRNKTMHDLARPEDGAWTTPDDGVAAAASCADHRPGNDKPSEPSPPTRNISRRATPSHKRTDLPSKASMREFRGRE